VILLHRRPEFLCTAPTLNRVGLSR